MLKLLKHFIVGALLISAVALGLLAAEHAVEHIPYIAETLVLVGVVWMCIILGRGISDD